MGAHVEQSAWYTVVAKRMLRRLPGADLLSFVALQQM